jgi:LETM1 and EF-hand domain-containing protein 1
VLLEKLDVDHDQFVPLSDIINLAEGEGLGIVIGEDDVIAEIVENVKEVAGPFDTKAASTPTEPETKKEKSEKPKLKKEDIVEG